MRQAQRDGKKGIHVTRLLVVEDDLKALRILLRGLSRRGYEVMGAGNVHDALVLGQTCKPQVLLTDWWLKDTGTGLEVAEALRRLDSTLVVIFFSGASMDALRIAARHLQPCTFLAKPFGLNTLEASLKRALLRSSHGDSVSI
jgi:DNA-binding response OmpR family regulator